MPGLISLLTTLVGCALTAQVLRQFIQRRKMHQLLWGLALGLFTLGAACQAAGVWWGWTPALYRGWYLSGAILTAAYLGMGSVYLQARRRLAHLTFAVLLLASLYATLAVLRAPVDLNAALNGPAISGAGMPPSVRWLTPFFNIFGTLALVGGALRSSLFFLWNGISRQKAAGTALLAAGAFIVASGGTLARFSRPEALPISELLGLALIYAGFWLTGRRETPAPLNPQQLTRRRQRLVGWSVGGAAAMLLGSVALLPILPWTMGIVTNARHVYTQALPQENRGAYLLTTNGVMQLYTWHVEPNEIPPDAPTLNAADIQQIAVVQKQFDPIENYRLYNLSTDNRLQLQETARHDMQLILRPAVSGPLTPGDYVLVVPTDSMYGGATWHYFRLR